MKLKQKIKRTVAFTVMLCFTSLTGAQPLYAVPANTQLPTGPNPIIGITDSQIHSSGSAMTIDQGNSQTSVIKWDNFSIGADASVTFKGPDGFNSFNYVNGGVNGPVSEIYGQLTALGGNIFIANPAGVQIGDSAQINVGSIYVTNKDVESAIENITANSNKSEIESAIKGITTTSNAELMSLGSITSATGITFDGSRVVLDTDRLYTGGDSSAAGAEQMTEAQIADSLKIITTDKSEVVLGYTAYATEDIAQMGTYAGKQKAFNININGNKESLNGYMWVEDIYQLQAMNTNLNGWYALRNAIDANYTASSGYGDGKGFNPIGDYDSNDSTKAFTGRFDGLGNFIFGLNIDRPNKTNVGLFGYINGAYVGNFTLNGGEIKGQNSVGSAVGQSVGGSVIEKIANTADVSGTGSNVGGIIGSASGNFTSQQSERTNLINLVNIGSVSGKNAVGGIIGNMSYIYLGGNTYNLGAVSGIGDDSYSVGGIAGNAAGSVIGDGTTQIYNRLSVTGGYNVGGIVGTLSDSLTSQFAEYSQTIVQNAANYGDVTATGIAEGSFSADNTYSYHQIANTQQSVDMRTANVANVGGIVGRASSTHNTITIQNVQNHGDVTSATATESDYDYYIAGNVGGVVGYANNTNITNAENVENLVAGAHNVGGVAGYLTGNSTVDNSINDGGDILGTGARDGNGFTGKENIPSGYYGDTTGYDSRIGNIGGVVGYLYNNDSSVKTTVKNSANRGTVHTTAMESDNILKDNMQAANVGGVVGKISIAAGAAASLDEIKSDNSNATVSNSYNAGHVMGYTGVGGVVGQTINGSVAGSYNLGDVRSTRTAVLENNEQLNMGGVVGDAGAWDSSKAVIYDVYNAGKIGDEDFKFYGRHVGGVVGRLSGTLDKAYNTGDIYNGYSVTGGIVGWWYAGNISNVFNTGNITVVNRDTWARNSLVAGIAGAANSERNKSLSYAYNIGTLRSFIPSGYLWSTFTDDQPRKPNINVVSGILNVTEDNKSQHTININNVYTTGNIYAARQGEAEGSAYESYDQDRISAIAAMNYNHDHSDSTSNTTVNIKNAAYIAPQDSNLFSNLNNGEKVSYDNRKGKQYTTVSWNDRTDLSKYKGWTIKDVTDNISSALTENDGWRIYDGQTMPMLNAFTPNTASTEDAWKTDAIASVQYGTEANPLLTIITLKENAQSVTLDWDKLGLSGAGGLAVYGGGLNVENFSTTLGSYYNGVLFSEGALTIGTAAAQEGLYFNLGSGSRLYGSSVSFNAGAHDTTLYGTITSTDGGIEIKGNNVNVIGALKSSTAGGTTRVEGIAQSSNVADSNVSTDEDLKIDSTLLNAPGETLPTIGAVYSYTTKEADKAGNISVTATGDAEVLYGNMSAGKIESGGTLSVTGDKSVYVDSDLHIGGDLNLKSDGEIVIDLSNMGDISKENLHTGFLDHFKKDGEGNSGGKITVGGAGAESFKIALDMWNGTGFNLDKYDVVATDYDGAKEHDLSDDISALNIVGISGSSQDYTYIWIDSIDQLSGIQSYYDEKTEADGVTYILKYNFALKDDIDASGFTDYNPIGSGEDADGKANAYTGVFDGRGFRIIGLDVNDRTDGITPTDAGVFGTIGGDTLDDDGNVTATGGTVKNLSVYSSRFTGESTAGAIAGVNEGTITNVTTFGNEIRVTGTKATETIKRGEGAGNEAGKELLVGAAGGIAGVNAGKIENGRASDTVIASEGDATDYGEGKTYITVAGGVAGLNQANIATGGIFNISSTSAVITDVEHHEMSLSHGLGGVVGINEGSLLNVSAFGATNGSYGGTGAAGNEYVGGIMGVNYSPYVYNAYNESVVIGASNVGGIAGKNEYRDDMKSIFGDKYTGGEFTNVVNAGSVTAIGNILNKDDHSSYAGGIVGSSHGGVINYGRNTGTVTGENYVGGIAGYIGEKATVKNLSNAVAAEITGKQYVGGIAGHNDGEIVGSSGLTNEGTVRGTQYVGGVAGLNTGTIENLNTAMKLEATGTDAQYFGGVAGQNGSVTATDTGGEEIRYGTITNATNTGSVEVAEGEYVGGITGLNSKGGILENAGNSGAVWGLANVGGVAGQNDSSYISGTIINSGGVMAGDVDIFTEAVIGGGAGGIFYKNTADLDGVTLINDGLLLGLSGEVPTGGVIGVNRGNITSSTLINNMDVVGAGNTGGVIGQNSGNITYSNLTNAGIVHGDENTGGLIGVNSANISKSNLVNEYGAQVTGGNNTGGLIGKNSGSVAGGRNDADTMYTYKVYNNGAVTGADNTGGVIGLNDGALTAAYNTGSVTGAVMEYGEVTNYTDNIGGVVGTNSASGTVSEVFSTIMTADGKNQSVTGNSNVGGIIGVNSGKLTNAYNTSAVIAMAENGVAGNLVGENTGEISNVYATGASGTLIGDNSGTARNVYTFAAGDGSATAITGDAQMLAASYEGFDFGSTWKNYDGWTTPMLKVFLTKATLNPDGSVTAADGLAAYNNASPLLVWMREGEAGEYFLTVYSRQIASSFNADGTFNPNNLGYDIEPTVVVVRGNYGWIYQDGWDRIRNFRERKAELHFINGGMEYVEGM